MLPKLALLGIATGTGGGWEESGHSWQESVPPNGGIGKNDSSDGIAVAFQRRCLNLGHLSGQLVSSGHIPT